MTSDQHEREMKTLIEKSFHKENNDDKINSRVSSHIKRKLSVDINIKDSLTAKLRLSIFTNFINQWVEQILDENMSG